MTQILLTGGSGAIGSALVPRLLRDNDTIVHLVLRADNEQQLQERQQQLLAYWTCDGMDSEVAPRQLRFHIGDVTQPRLGLTEAVYGPLTEQLTHILHCAGNVKLNQSLEAARQSAVGSTQHVLELLRDCQRRNAAFSKLDVTSTIGVAGRLPGLIPERRLHEPRAYHNTYEQSKAEAEELLWQAIDAGAPLTIHRPSMVIGDSRTGRIVHFQVFYYLLDFLSGRRSYGILPELKDAQLDIVPVDYVADALACSLHSPATIGRVFHLCAGPEHAPQLAELSKIMRQLLAERGDRLPRLRFISVNSMRAIASAVGFVATGKPRKALKNLPYFLAYLAQRQQFAASATHDFFRKNGYDLPDFHQYLRNVVGHYLAHRKTASKA